MSRKAVPKGYREIWAYRGVWNEVKTGTGRWKFTFRATKHRGSKTLGNFPIGTKGAWKITAIQRIIKTRTGQYQTIMYGTKQSLGFRIPRRRKRT